jgi:peptide/nickel transport system substrate-binding protein
VDPGGIVNPARLLAVALLMPALLACRDNGGGARSAGVAAESSTITLLYDFDEYLMSPVEDEEPKHLVFLPLASQQEDGEFTGRLARSWEHSADYRTWTFHLRTDVRWHDGVPVTAADVAFTVALLSHPAVAYHPPGAVSADVLNDSTVVIAYRARPGGALTDVLWWDVYLPAHLLQGMDPATIATWDFWAQPVGDGPYRYVRHVPKTMMELEANPDYYAGPPTIERVILKFGPPNVLELQAGNVDVIPYVNPADAAVLATDPRFRVYHYINPLLGRMIEWNHRDPRLADVRVRLALTHAIDRREVIRAIDLPDWIPVVDGPHTDRAMTRGELPAPIPFDLDEADRLLAEAGWRDTDGDGIRERDGAELRIRMIVPSDPEWERMAVVVQSHLRRAGVALETLTINPAALASRMERGDVGAILNRYIATPDRLRRYFGENSPMGYRNPIVSRLIDSLATAVEPDAQDRLYGEITRIFREDVPATFLIPRVATVAASQRVRGLQSPFRVFPSRIMAELWIEEDS